MVYGTFDAGISHILMWEVLSEENVDDAWMFLITNLTHNES